MSVYIGLYYGDTSNINHTLYRSASVASLGCKSGHGEEGGRGAGRPLNLGGVYVRFYSAHRVSPEFSRRMMAQSS